MFKQLVETLFSDEKNNKSQPDYEYFEKTRDNEKVLSKEAVDSLSKLLTVGNEGEVKKSQQVIKADIEDQVQQRFFSFLFGVIKKSEAKDPITDYVSLKIGKLLEEPKLLLDALPVLPHSVSTLLTAVNNPDFNVKELLTIIETEPSMAADMVKLANSSRYKRGENDVTDLKSAFMNMGSQGLLEGVIYVYLNKFVPKNSIYFKLFGQNIWQNSVQAANFAKRIVAKSELKEQVNTAYFAGLILNLGQMVIFQLLIDAFAHVEPSAKPNTLAFQRLFQRFSAKISYDIAQYWALPDALLRILAVQLNITQFKLSSLSQKENKLGVYVFEANKLSELKSLVEHDMLKVNEYELALAHFIDSPEGKVLAKEAIVL